MLLDDFGPATSGWVTIAPGVDAFVCHGASPRPLAVITAGIHGDEYEGPAAIAELARCLKPAELLGSVIAIPVANPMAWRAAQRMSPDDDLNLARTFPGDPSGSPTQRLAAAVFDVARQADFLIDLHSGGVEYLFVPLAGFYGEPREGNASFDAARRFGLPYLWQLPPTAGVLSHECSKLGIPVVGCEYLGAGQLSLAGAEAYAAGVASCLAFWGIRATTERERTPQQVITGDWILAPAEGMFRAHCRLEDPVAPGRLLAEVRDPRGQVVDRLTAQGSGVVIALRSKAYIRKGDWGVLVGSLV